MNINPHLRNLDYVIGLAQAEANASGEDQAIYKTKDAKRYEIFQFVPAYKFGGNAVRVIRFSRENIREGILQDIGNEQPSIAVPKPRKAKGKGHGTVERDLARPFGLLLPSDEQASVGELSEELPQCSEDSE